MRWVAILPLYLALSFTLLAIAYAGAGPRLLLKRGDGSRAVLGWVLFAPYFMLNAITFGLYRVLTRELAYVQVTPTLFFGRRLSSHEHRMGGWSSVLDLACEFTAPKHVRKLPGYRSLPVLDATAPIETELRSALDWLSEAVATGPVYVHCALGHGRSACVVIAYLLTIGTVATAKDGIKLLRSKRPGVRLHPSQLHLLRGFEPNT